jgi:hypothetical protein
VLSTIQSDQEPFRLYGFNATRPDGSRVGVIIRWKPDDDRFPTPLDKVQFKRDYRDWEVLNFLPVNTKVRYDTEHPWDWQRE